MWLWALQIAGRAIFIYHRGKPTVEGLKLLSESAFYGFKLDLSMVAYLFIFSLFFVIAASVFKRKIMLSILFYFLIAISCLTFIIAFADAEMYRIWGSRFNSQALQYMQHPQEALASSSEAKWAQILVVTIILTVLFYYFLRKIMRSENSISTHRWIPSGTAMLCAVLCIPLLRGGFQTIPINQSSVYYSTDVFENNAAVNGLWNAMYYVTNPLPEIDPEEYRFGIGTANYSAYFPAEKRELYAIAETEKPNVVLFILESHSSYVSQFFGKTYNATPFLDSMAKTGLAFTNAYAQGDRTDKGLAATLSGWPGQPWQSILLEPDRSAKLPSIAQQAKKLGYKTSFFYGGDAAFGNMLVYLRHSQYETIVDEAAFAKAQKGSKWGVHDGFLMQRAGEELSRQKAPFFATILTLSSHEPYEVPGEKNTGDELQRFLASISYTDRCLRQFMAYSAGQPWFRNTVFVFVADHGRNVGLPNMDFFQPRHFQVPVIFWGPALSPSCQGKIDPRICGQTDIAATVVEALLGGSAEQFTWSRQMNESHPEAAFYTFSDGFGYVGPGGHVVWGNHPPAIMERSGSSDSMLLTGKSLQYSLIKKYKNF